MGNGAARRGAARLSTLGSRQPIIMARTAGEPPSIAPMN